VIGSRLEEEMARRMIGSVVLALVLAAIAVGAAPAYGDGLPVPGVADAGPGGVALPGGEDRYVALPAGKDTLVARVQADGGEVRRSTVLEGDYTVPAVALDGSPDGLSADGGTLTLINPRQRFPREETSFIVLDTSNLAIRERITLRGDFSFDAMSPDGSRLYLVEYLSRRDATEYAVRAYDLPSGRLLPEPIEDPDEPASEMGGYPITRAASPHGRWAYTLYDGSGSHPFVHALDTARGEAVCIDLHGLNGNLNNLRFEVSPDGGELAVVGREGPVTLVDTQTFETSDPPQPPDPAVETDDGGVPWGFVAPMAVVLLLGAIALGSAMHSRRRLHPDATRGLAPELDDPAPARDDDAFVAGPR